MTCEVLPGFLRDLKRLGNKRIQTAVAEAIEQIRSAASLSDIAQVKKLKGYPNFYRMRVGDYRIGLQVDGQTVRFIRCLHRREIYRRFP